MREIKQSPEADFTMESARFTRLFVICNSFCSEYIYQVSRKGENWFKVKFGQSPERRREQAAKEEKNTRWISLETEQKAGCAGSASTKNMNKKE